MIRRVDGPASSEAGFSRAYGTTAQGEGGVDLRSACFREVPQGSALARARVKHLTVPAGAVSPIFRASC